MIGESLIQHVHTLVVNADDYLVEKKANGKQKQKWFRRGDIAIWGFFLLIGVLLFAIPHTSTQTSTPANSTNNHPGKGGVDTAQCASVPIPPCFSTNNTSGVSLPPNTTTPSVDPSAIIDNWNNTGQTVTAQTYDGTPKLVASGDFLIDYNQGSLFFTNPAYTVDNPDIRGLWTTFTQIVGFFLVIAIIFSSYKMMFGGGGFRYAEAVESLPRALLAGISAFMSIVFIALVFTISNGLNHVVLDYMTGSKITINQIVMPVNDWQNYISILLNNIKNLFQGNVAGGTPIIGGIFTIAANIGSIPDLVNNLRNFIWLILTIMLASQVILRLATLNIYIVTSPLAFVCGAFPSQQGQQVARAWAAGFFTTLFVQFVQILAMYVGWIVFNGILNGLSVQAIHTTTLAQIANPSIPTINLPSWVPGSTQVNAVTGTQIPVAVVYLDNLAPLVTLWFMLRVPRLFSSSAMQSITSAGQVLTGAMRSAIGVAGI